MSFASCAPTAPSGEREALSDHFTRVAVSYAAWRPTYPEELFDFLASLVHRRRLAWDCGAGSGQATLPLASRFESVIGTDISRAMLEQAPRHPRVDYRAAPAEASGLPTASVDLVTVAQALHWMDLQGFYAEVARVLVPGGVLAVWSYGSPRLETAALQRELSSFYSDVVGPYWPESRRYVDEGYRTLPFPYPELDSPVFAMQQRWTRSQLLGYVGTWSATLRFRDMVGRDPLPELERELARDWGSETTRRVQWPIVLRVGRKPVQ
jgi:SAM-dependent methyltransferase